MGYKIYYGTKKAGVIQKNKRKSNFPVLIVCMTTVIFIIIYTIVSKIGTGRFIFPESYDITAAAIDTLTEDLKTGMPFVDAFSAFCLKILNHGQ